MAKKTTSAQEVTTSVVAPEVVAETTTEQVADAAAEVTTEGIIFELSERVEELVAEAKKRVRSYSQTAINTSDLERLNAFKSNIKETRNISVSNQTILAAALDCLSQEANMEAFLKMLVAATAEKQRSKDLKAFEVLRAKLELNETTEA